MYESFFEMRNTPFARNLPPSNLFITTQIQEVLGRLTYAADHQLFAVLTAGSGCGKSTVLRTFATRECHCEA